MIKKSKLIFDNIKDCPFASIMSALVMLVSLLLAFVFSRSIKALIPELGFVSTQMMLVLYCIIICFGVFNVVCSYVYLFRKLEKRMYLYRLIGATKLDILLIQIFEVFVKYNVVFLISILISEFLIGLAEGYYFPPLTIVENVIIYFVMLAVILLSVILSFARLLFSKNTMTNKEFL